MHDEVRPLSLSKTPTSNQQPEPKTQKPSSVDLHVLCSESETPFNKRTPEGWWPTQSRLRLRAQFSPRGFFTPEI
jgi:hypothetical protein